MTRSTITLPGGATVDLVDEGPYNLWSTIWLRTWRQECEEALIASTPWYWQLLVYLVGTALTVSYELPRSSVLSETLGDLYFDLCIAQVSKADPVVNAFLEVGSDLEWGLDSDEAAELFDQRMQEDCERDR